MTIYELCYNFNRINTLSTTIFQIATNLRQSWNSMNWTKSIHFFVSVVVEHNRSDAKRFFLHRVCENVSFIYRKILKSSKRRKKNEKPIPLRSFGCSEKNSTFNQVDSIQMKCYAIDLIHANNMLFNDLETHW